MAHRMQWYMARLDKMEKTTMSLFEVGTWAVKHSRQLESFELTAIASLATLLDTIKRVKLLLHKAGVKNYTLQAIEDGDLYTVQVFAYNVANDTFLQIRDSLKAAQVEPPVNVEKRFNNLFN
jgi:hypothetical protein